MSDRTWASKARGLDLAQPDVTTVDEWDAWRQNERANRGWPLESYELLAEVGRSADVKRWMLQIRQFRAGDDSFNTPLLWVQHYLLTGFAQGLTYELQNCQRMGHRRVEVAETIAVAFLHSPSGELTEAAPIVREKLRSYVDSDEPFVYPVGWEPDPDAFVSGLDFSQPELTAEELELLEGWYRRVLGEIPPSVQFLARFRPRMLKAWRNRFEHVVHVMPKQMMPFLLLHFECLRGHEAGIREAVLLSRGFGLTLTQTCDAIVWSMLYGGHGATGNAWRAAGDILESW
jgi:hypothetical protein